MKNAHTYFDNIGFWPRKENHTRAYVVGFLASLIITLAMYVLATHQVFPFRITAIILLAIACVQFIVQAVCFLHLGRERGSRDRLALLMCAILVLLILVVGSLWIMFSLNGRMMPSTAQMEQYMNDQDGI